jgi:hypothetical protein
MRVRPNLWYLVVVKWLHPLIVRERTVGVVMHAGAKIKYRWGRVVWIWRGSYAFTILLFVLRVVLRFFVLTCLGLLRHFKG